jgi:hypothetical protein
MDYSNNLTTEQKLEKAIWAAHIFCRHCYRGIDLWVVERSLISRTIVGNSNKIIDSVNPSLEEKIIVRGAIIGSNQYGWWEAVTLAEALEQKKYLP